MPESTFYTRVHKWYREFLARFVVWKKKRQLQFKFKTFQVKFWGIFTLFPKTEVYKMTSPLLTLGVPTESSDHRLT